MNHREVSCLAMIPHTQLYCDLAAVQEQLYCDLGCRYRNRPNVGQPSSWVLPHVWWDKGDNFIWYEK